MKFDIIHHQQNSMLVFDSNSLSSECYYMLQDITDTLQNNNNKVVIALNQSDTYLPELTKSDYIKINNTFSDGELSLLTPETNLHGFTERRTRNSNLDYLNILKKEQSIPISLDLKLPNEYTNNEQIILLLHLVQKIKSIVENLILYKLNILKFNRFLVEFLYYANGYIQLKAKAVHIQHINLYTIVRILYLMKLEK